MQDFRDCLSPSSGMDELLLDITVAARLRRLHPDSLFQSIMETHYGI
jgi:hypothetical protein